MGKIGMAVASSSAIFQAELLGLKETELILAATGESAVCSQVPAKGVSWLAGSWLMAWGLQSEINCLGGQWETFLPDSGCAEHREPSCGSWGGDSHRGSLQTFGLR